MGTLKVQNRKKKQLRDNTQVLIFKFSSFFILVWIFIPIETNLEGQKFSLSYSIINSILVVSLWSPIHEHNIQHLTLEKGPQKQPWV